LSRDAKGYTSHDFDEPLILGVLNADDQAHYRHEPGTVHIRVSCTSAAQKTFNRGIALLHSFRYDEAEKAFIEVTARNLDAPWAIGASL
jgi:hypothetical protein